MRRKRTLARIKITDNRGNVQTECTSDKRISNNEIFIIIKQLRQVEEQLINILKLEGE